MNASKGPAHVFVCGGYSPKDCSRHGEIYYVSVHTTPDLDTGQTRQPLWQAEEVRNNEGVEEGSHILRNTGSTGRVLGRARGSGPMVGTSGSRSHQPQRSRPTTARAEPVP